MPSSASMNQAASQPGVPVFLADVKGDLAGIAMPGSPTFEHADKLEGRAAELGITLAFEGEGVNERAVVLKVEGEKAPALRPGDVIVKVDPRYFRPTEVETLLGDPSNAKAKLGWVPQIALQEMVTEMVVSDLNDARRHALLQRVRHAQEIAAMARHRGRGMASINYPIGMNLGGDPSQALVHSNPDGKFTVALSAIDLGHHFGLRVVAEGVESASTVAELRRLGCDLAQGHAISPALSSTAFLDWWSKHASGS